MHVIDLTVIYSYIFSFCIFFSWLDRNVKMTDFTLIYANQFVFLNFTPFLQSTATDRRYQVPAQHFFFLYNNHLDVLHNVEENICYYFHFYHDFKYWTLVCNLSRSICAVGMNDTLDHVRLRCASTFQSIITSIPTGYSSWSVKRWEKIDVQLATTHMAPLFFFFFSSEFFVKMLFLDVFCSVFISFHMISSPSSIPWKATRLWFWFCSHKTSGWYNLCLSVKILVCLCPYKNNPMILSASFWGRWCLTFCAVLVLEEHVFS